MSNYPPGVSGLEYQIAGADFEEERNIFCPRCDVIQEMLVEGYHREISTSCPKCHLEIDLSDDDGYFDD